MLALGNIESVDARLASLAREEGALRLRLGQLLEVLGRGAVFDLGFSSLGAYAVERCERSVRWVEAARSLARRVEALPELRRALALGKVSWSMGEVLARVATPADEERWLALAESRTVRQVRQRVGEALSAVSAADRLKAQARSVLLEQPVVAAGAFQASAGELGAGASRDEELCTLTCTVDREDAWLFEATLCLLDRLGERGVAAQSEALLAEAQGTLLAFVSGCSRRHGAIDGGYLQEANVAQQRWAEQLGRWRAEAEERCEPNILCGLASARAAGSLVLSPLAVATALGIASLEDDSCVALDRQVRALSSALARHELLLSELVLRFHRADGWRRLGYATEAQYACERLGLSRSGLAARRALALRLERLPGVAAALGAAQIGVEAALQVVRIATLETEAAWIERASRRTVKHLREEVAAALVAVRLSGESDCPPPEDDELAAFQSLERAVVGGRLGESRALDEVRWRIGSVSRGEADDELVGPASPRGTWYVMLASLATWLGSGLADGRQMSAAPGRAPSRRCMFAGRVTLRLRVSRDTFAWWRGLEAQARRWLPPGTSWLRFVCLSFWQSWRHVLGAEVAYGDIYGRDRYRCTSPVCNRRDVTPHHIRFRSAGGGDEASNLTSPCTWCHLHGVHGGRIRASGTAELIRWELGPRGAPCVVVQGRERMVA